MAIVGPADLPVVLKVSSDPLKAYVLAKLGHSNVEVELSEQQFEIILKSTCDFIAGYFPHEQRLSWFYTTPMQSTYPIPSDAYWIQEVSWSPLATNVNDLFGAEAYLYNTTSSILGQANFLTDYHLLQSYRKFSAKLLSTEGHWDFINEVDGDTTKQLIRLYPTPKGAFPVIVVYTPVISHFRSPQAKLIAYDWLLAESKIVLGSSRRKLAGMPTPDGGSINYDGGDLVAEGTKEKDELVGKAIRLSEPLGIYTW